MKVNCNITASWTNQANTNTGSNLWLEEKKKKPTIKLETLFPERKTPARNLQHAVVQDGDFGSKVTASIPGGNSTAQLFDNDILSSEYALVYGSNENCLQYSDVAAYH